MRRSGRAFDTAGNTLDYVYETEGDWLTIRGGEKGSPAYYRGSFSADGTANRGRGCIPAEGTRPR